MLINSFFFPLKLNLQADNLLHLMWLRRFLDVFYAFRKLGWSKSQKSQSIGVCGFSNIVRRQGREY